ncbi:hypothetical protein TVAG_216230 [Trichomonas vaginalis G3]|uniref:Uncharacterized protein n=1 Tax=Trichomonas vaginalis (strain ATCC PRA-98 / G3) TaxID=412133 RepID=A2ENV7_TRIV3|nr:hypothetical protein TVAGG3_0249350 [Trichomonas vaginalis G3]EAY05647.1 hypothetical protein TVAG_216230 [Trichomonas vaginalis G3]KAI5553887.1 hypothetical protein TVAGG3_0249350 [Trichomonas vaginalis G3]|eukprot:XP_001317870.1 hypothetical protein [Trichomonas vaginalis G3]
MLFLLFSHISSIRTSVDTVRRDAHNWKLDDGRTLFHSYNHTTVQTCTMRFSSSTHYAKIFDGAKNISFTNTSGKVKLADGREAFVGNDNFLRIMSSDLEKVETYMLGYQSPYQKLKIFKEEK